MKTQLSELIAIVSRDQEITSMGLLDGKVAFVTGAARGQGRSHALRLAQQTDARVRAVSCGAAGHSGLGSG